MNDIHGCEKTHVETKKGTNSIVVIDLAPSYCRIAVMRP